MNGTIALLGLFLLAPPAGSEAQKRKPYVETVSSVRALFFQPEPIAENWCKARDGNWFARGNKDKDDPRRIAFCTFKDKPNDPPKVGLHLDIYEQDVIHLSYYWTEGTGDPKALVDAATALYGKPIRLQEDGGCEEAMWDAGPAAAAKAAVEVKDCESSLYLNVLPFFSEKQATSPEPDPEAEEYARIAKWSNSLPDALNYEPPLDQLGRSAEAFRAWCRRTTGAYSKRPDTQACDFGAQIVTYRRTPKLDEMVIIFKGFPGSSDTLRELLKDIADEVAALYRTTSEKHPSVEVKASDRVTRFGDFVGTGTLFRDGRAVAAYAIEQRGITARATHTKYH